jgi:ABC-type polysaccharide/polyol phosphate transport system ATPase subunit
MVAIRIRGIGKYFGPSVEIDGAERPREAWRTLMRIAGFNINSVSDDDIHRTVAVSGHVLRDVTLDIQQGSVVCLSGASGSGKSVLLSVLAGVSAPTTGCVEIYGAVSSLLSIGDNLNERLTAVENIRALPELQGATAEEAERFTSEVIEFAELEGFEHVPLRTYSTGMSLRLSVGLALCGGAPIVLIDDVFGVGDIAFQQKCIDRVHVLKKKGYTLVAAFSDELLVQQIATRVVTLEAGRVVSDAPPRYWATSRYASSAAEVEWSISSTLPEDDVMALRTVSVSAGGHDDETFITVASTFTAKAGQARCRPSIFLMRDRTVVFRSIYPQVIDVDAARDLLVAARIPTHMLPNGEYALTISMTTVIGRQVYSMKTQAVALTIRRPLEPTDQGTTALLAMTMAWEIESLQESVA